jgi:hypothetical protein
MMTLLMREQWRALAFNLDRRHLWSQYRIIIVLSGLVFPGADLFTAVVLFNPELRSFLCHWARDVAFRTSDARSEGVLLVVQLFALVCLNVSISAYFIFLIRSVGKPLKSFFQLPAPSVQNQATTGPSSSSLKIARTATWLVVATVFMLGNPAALIGVVIRAFFFHDIIAEGTFFFRFFFAFNRIGVSFAKIKAITPMSLSAASVERSILTALVGAFQFRNAATSRRVLPESVRNDPSDLTNGAVEPVARAARVMAGRIMHSLNAISSLPQELAHENRSLPSNSQSGSKSSKSSTGSSDYRALWRQSDLSSRPSTSDCRTDPDVAMLEFQ